jgi:uncharacterized protein YkwD
MPERLAGDRGRFWPVGYSVKVEWLDGSTETQDRTLEQLRAWSEFANLDFEPVARNGDIRVTYRRPGNWSLVGRDALLAPPGEPTFCMQDFDRLPFPSSEWRRVGGHEGGHVCGFLHELQRLTGRLRWDAVIARYARDQGWPPEVTITNILTPLNMVGLLATPEADERSIMTYEVDGSLTVDGLPIVGGTDLSEGDKRIAALAYPGRWTPPATSSPPAKPDYPHSLADLAEVNNRFLFDLINPARIRAGLESLSIDWRIAGAASVWAEQLAVRGVLEHNGPEGTTPALRVRASGFPLGALDQVDELVGSADPGSSDAEMFAAWMASPPHRAAILGPWAFLGIGRDSAGGRPYWCVDFASEP